MSIRLALVAAAFAAALAAPAGAKTFRFAAQGDYASADPHALNEVFTLGLHGAVYEGLVKRDRNLAIVPGLAERWEVVDPLRWRFHLRRGVTFHDGSAFTADDVLFSAQRARGPNSDLKERVPAGATFVKVDDHTVDVVLKTPNPILPAEWETWYIVSKSWAERNGAVKPAAAGAAGYAALHANGTGPFVLASHQPGVRTVWRANPAWWGVREHNLDEAVFTPIASDPTRVAALLSGDIDMMDPVPPQDIARVAANPNTRVLARPELRTIFLGLDQRRDQLIYSDVKGRNPFKDLRVRQAFAKAIDLDLIRDRIMRGTSEPAALLISPLLFAGAKDFKPVAADLAGARRLLAEAGYPQGFAVGLDCPNDRYVNDDAICQAIVGMLARAGVRVSLNLQPKTRFFAKVLAGGGYDTSFYLLGWTPNSFDSWNVLSTLVACRDDAGTRGPFNLGGYCNPALDALTARILVETDLPKRDAMIRDAWAMERADMSHIPLHQQGIAWGVSLRVEMVQRADNQILLYWVRME